MDGSHPRRQWFTRPERDTDIPAIHAINRAAFDRSAEADLVDALRDDPAWIDGLSQVVVDIHDQPVGHVLLSRCHIGSVPALCLAPCAVLTDQQGRGAGAAAIRAVLAAATEMGERFVVVLGHPTYYPRFGFSRASDFDIRVSIDVPDDALMALSLDPAVSPPAGLVRYAAPFGI